VNVSQFKVKKKKKILDKIIKTLLREPIKLIAMHRVLNEAVKKFVDLKSLWFLDHELKLFKYDVLVVLKKNSARGNGLRDK